jgi:hypothetical protein
MALSDYFVQGIAMGIAPSSYMQYAYANLRPNQQCFGDLCNCSIAASYNVRYAVFPLVQRRRVSTPPTPV